MITWHFLMRFELVRVIGVPTAWLSVLRKTKAFWSKRCSFFPGGSYLMGKYCRGLNQSTWILSPIEQARLNSVNGPSNQLEFFHSLGQSAWIRVGLKQLHDDHPFWMTDEERTHKRGRSAITFAIKCVLTVCSFSSEFQCCNVVRFRFLLIQ